MHFLIREMIFIDFSSLLEVLVMLMIANNDANVIFSLS